jgi:CBS domain-containing protein
MDKKLHLVADVMTIDPIVLEAGASLEDADVLLRSSFVMGLPVVDRNGVLVGIMAQTDLVAYRFANRTPRSTEVTHAGDPVS